MCRARCDGIDNRKRGRGARKSSKTDRRGSGAGTVCLKAAVVDTVRGISTQSKQRNRMRMRTSVVHSREVGGQTANLVPIVSVVVPTVPPPSPRPCSPSGAESAPIVPRLLRLRISLARNTTLGQLCIYYYFMPVARAGKRGKESVCAVVDIPLCARAALCLIVTSV